MALDPFSIRCVAHEKPCYVKTGVREGPNKGKSFLVCSTSTPCDFNMKIKLPARICPTHHQMVELSRLSEKNGEPRVYIRCAVGKEEHKWCSHGPPPSPTDVENNGVIPVVSRTKSDQRALKDVNVVRQQQPLLSKKPVVEKVDLTMEERTIVRPKTAPVLSSKQSPTGQTNGLSLLKPVSAPVAALKSEQSSTQSTTSSQALVSSQPLTSRANGSSLFKSTAGAQSSGLKSNQSMVKPQTTSQSLIKAQSTTVTVQKEKSDALQVNKIVQHASNPYAARAYILYEIEKKKGLLKMADRLPDKGVKVQEQLCGLEKALEEFKSLPEKEPQAEPALKPVPERPIIMNRTGGVQHCAPQELSQNALQQTYSSFGAGNQLYGGRMTAGRLQTVTTITTEAIEKLHKQLESRPSPEQEASDPKHLKVTLMTHQRQALQWMDWREKQEPSGGILADDMGLGKTLTMISHVMKDKQARQPTDDSGTQWLNKASGVLKSDCTLIVCPASIIHQWFKEIQARCKEGSVTVVLYHGDKRERSIMKLTGADIVLTTYSLIIREVGLPPALKSNKALQEMPIDDTQAVEGDGLLTKIGWRRIILDEAHNIKNYRSSTALCVCRLRAKHRWALTGTPIQNDLTDMYSLLKYLRCSPFNELKVWKRWVDNKQSSGSKRLSILVKSLLLRRTKDQKTSSGAALVPLPERNVHIHELKLSGHEKAIYDQLFKRSKQVMVNYLAGHEDNSVQATGLPPGGKVKGDTILLMLLRLRQCCGHPSLTKEILEDEEVKQEGIDLDIVSAMKQLDIQEEKKSTDDTQTSSQLDCGSSKINFLLCKIREIRASDKTGKPTKFVVVSQWTSMLDIVAMNLEAEGLRYNTIRGDVSPKVRAQMVEQFNLDPQGAEVMLVSLRAGGVGLNLIGGNHLFLLDLHWNPALELQACDRVYRMGQTKDVNIHKFVCKETVEEKILLLQRGKMAMADGVLTGAKVEQSKLSLKDLKTLFGIGEFRDTTGASAGFHR